MARVLEQLAQLSGLVAELSLMLSFIQNSRLFESLGK